jgi:hypothetical protein
MDNTIYIPLGSNCSIAKQLQTHKLRQCSLPFDWTKLNINKLINVLKNNFIDFHKLQYIKNSNKHNILDEDKLIFIPNTSSLILKNCYGVKFAHIIQEKDYDKIKELENKLLTRIERFKKILNNEKKEKIFIRIELSVINPENYIKQLFQLLHLIEINSKGTFKIIIMIEKLYYMQLIQFIQRIMNNDYTLFTTEHETIILKSNIHNSKTINKKQIIINKVSKIIRKYQQQILYINQFIIFKEFYGFNEDYFRNDIDWQEIFNIL